MFAVLARASFECGAPASGIGAVLKNALSPRKGCARLFFTNVTWQVYDEGVAPETRTSLYRACAHVEIEKLHKDPLLALNIVAPVCPNFTGIDEPARALTPLIRCPETDCPSFEIRPPCCDEEDADR